MNHNFMGPYNTLLNYLFPFEEDFVVVPQFKRPEQSKFTTIFIISRDGHPVLFVEVETIRSFSTHFNSDIQMHETFKVLFDDVRVPKLYGISAMGTRICVYTMDRNNGEILPEAIPHSPTRVTDTASAERWRYDIVQPGVEDVVRGIVDES
ncbi:hypothetical protein L211DRAFT_821000 [Terfezia boudieri ATCC MYA-4762]|uniref:Uncharacterized protein n=1 Tax=Terfezia boudieri ATCC MYA-4762 TaxID=1051890 RepID=A0A3N4M809_9PEZI|nr:hypothetical protein L211DRAFT_821000 [Terfezia boudieri ATCC MYA-4762]